LRATLSRALGTGDLDEAYRQSRDLLRSDQREILPIIATLLGQGAPFEIASFALSDYAEILAVDPPCLVASALVAYG